MNALQISSEARQALSRIFLLRRFQPGASKLSNKGNLLLRYFSPHRKTGGEFGQTVGATGLFSALSPAHDSENGFENDTSFPEWARGPVLEAWNIQIS
jgi:hypothetical protein